MCLEQRFTATENPCVHFISEEFYPSNIFIFARHWSFVSFLVFSCPHKITFCIIVNWCCFATFVMYYPFWGWILLSCCNYFIFFTYLDLFFSALKIPSVRVILVTIWLVVPPPYSKSFSLKMKSPYSHKSDFYSFWTHKSSSNPTCENKNCELGHK